MLSKVLFFILAFITVMTAFSSQAFAAEFHSCTHEHLEEAIPDPRPATQADQSEDR